MLLFNTFVIMGILFGIAWEGYKDGFDQYTDIKQCIITDVSIVSRFTCSSSSEHAYDYEFVPSGPEDTTDGW